jgi:preprotein translocase subunit Sss1
MNKQIEEVVQGAKQFYGESRKFIDVCEKPDIAGTLFYN